MTTELHLPDVTSAGLDGMTSPGLEGMTSPGLEGMTSPGLEGMTSPGRGLLILLTVLVLLLGLLGNGTVLYASLACRAIDIDRVSVLLIEQLALADVLIVVVEFVPMLVTLISGGWVLGEVFCTIQSFGRFVPFVLETVMICVMSCYRLYVVTMTPLVPVRLVWFYVLVVMTWMTPLCGIGISFLAPTTPRAHYNPAQLACTINNITDEGLEYSYLSLGGVVFILPLILTATSSLALLVSVFRITRRLPQSLPNRSAIVTTLGVCLAFTLSYVPQFVEFVAVVNVGRGVLPPWGVLLVTYCLAINLVSNPAIYVLSNRRFKEFVVEMLRSGPNAAIATIVARDS